MKCTMESNNGCALPLKLKTQLKINVKHNLNEGALKIGNHECLNVQVQKSQGVISWACL